MQTTVASEKNEVAVASEKNEVGCVALFTRHPSHMETESGHVAGTQLWEGEDD